MMHTMAIFAILLDCMCAHDSPLPDGLQKLSDKVEQQSLEAEKGKGGAGKDARIPLEAKEGNPVQISLIITNGAKQEEAKGSSHEKESTPRQRLSEMLLKPNPVNTLGREDVLSLIKLNNEIRSTSLRLQKMSESSNKILRKSGFVDSAGQKDLVNYHVIEITENKTK